MKNKSILTGEIFACGRGNNVEASCLGIFANCDKYKNLNWARKIPNHI